MMFGKRKQELCAQMDFLRGYYKLYRELVSEVSMDWPESIRHEKALEYIKQGRLIEEGQARICEPTILHLTLKRKWFDLILAGIKLEEYREIKPYWDSRLKDREYDQIKFRHGYSADARSVLVECEGIRIGQGRPEWGAGDKQCYIIDLGRIIREQQ